MDQVRAKKAKRKVPKKKQKKRRPVPAAPTQQWTCKKFPEVFNILPARLFHPRIANLLSFCTASLKQQASVIRSCGTCPFRSKSQPVQDINTFWSPLIGRELVKGLTIVLKARRLFKILLHHWRVKHLKKANEDDIVTLALPKNPIYLIDWSTKSSYVFEAQTIARDMMERLLCHDGLWEDCQELRNPYTNQPLTLSQIISIYQQLSHAPIQLCWAVAAFRQVRYSLPRFRLEYSRPLQLYAYRKTMRDPTHPDYQDRMIDFIEYAYDQEAIDCLTTTYTYILKHFTTNPIIKAWEYLCYQFYEYPILYANSPQELQKLQDLILIQTRPLLPRQEELKQIRFLHLRLNRQITASQNVATN